MHKIFQTKRYGFTLVELMLVMVIISIIVPSMFAMYQFIINANKEVRARHETIEQGYEFFEKLNILMQDYTVDYEEYYNRQMVGCNEGGGSGSSFTRNVGTGGYCKNFTAYGNNNSTNRKLGNSNISKSYHDIYYCSSDQLKQGTKRYPSVVVKKDCGRYGIRQSFGQYSKLFIDVHTVKADKLYGNPVGDSDDENLGKPVISMTNQGNGNNSINAIEDADHIQELYFISHDGKRRLYFRRKLINSKDKYTQYKIQMLRLRGFDAGRMHNFSEITDNEGLYDGKIDTRACDASMGFNGNGDSIDGAQGAYSGYRLPVDENDCRIDLTHGSTTMMAWNIIISPTNDSDLYWADATHQINAYMKILIVNIIYPPYYGTMAESATEFKVPLETIINMKDFYRN